MNNVIHIKEVFEAYNYKLYKASEYKVSWKSCKNGCSIEMRPVDDIRIQIIYNIDNQLVYAIHVILKTNKLTNKLRLLWIDNKIREDFLKEFKDIHNFLLHTKREIFDLVTLKLKNG